MCDEQWKIPHKMNTIMSNTGWKNCSIIQNKKRLWNPLTQKEPDKLVLVAFQNGSYSLCKSNFERSRNICTQEIVKYEVGGFYVGHLIDFQWRFYSTSKQAKCFIYRHFIEIKDFPAVELTTPNLKLRSCNLNVMNSLNWPLNDSEEW